MSLYYPFPIIMTLDDVIPHIDGNFRVIEKEGLVYINYNQMGNDVFPPVEATKMASLAVDPMARRAAIRRECRGITFDAKTGAIISRPFHKFFNAGEREDVSLDKIDLSRSHQLLEKLDGSMIRPLPTEAGMRWGTKMGITDTAMLAEEFVADKPEYYLLSAHFTRLGMTPLFEFCSRRNRIVLDYPEETMVLLAVRNNQTGEYLSRDVVRANAGAAGVPVVEYVDIRGRMRPEDDHFIEAVSNLDQTMAGVKADEEGEGKILFFDDGHAVKIKSDRYVDLHRAKDQMRSEMRLLKVIQSGKIDDLLPALDEEDRERVHEYIERFHHARRVAAWESAATFYEVFDSHETKKDFALSELGKEMPPALKSLVFGMWDGKVLNPADHSIQAGMTTETKFAEMKQRLQLDTGWDEIWTEDAV